MMMTNFEIKRAYREARNRRAQVKILAQLNACSPGAIRLIIADEMAAIKDIKGCELDERRKLYEEGYSDAMIAKLVGISAAGVRAWRMKNNLTSNVTHKYDYDEMHRLWSMGCTDREIADKVGCPSSYISSWRWHQGLTVNKKERR